MTNPEKDINESLKDNDRTMRGRGWNLEKAKQVVEDFVAWKKAKGGGSLHPDLIQKIISRELTRADYNVFLLVEIKKFATNGSSKPGPVRNRFLRNLRQALDKVEKAPK